MGDGGQSLRGSRPTDVADADETTMFKSGGTWTLRTESALHGEDGASLIFFWKSKGSPLS